MPVQFQSYSPPSTQRPIVLPPQPSIAQSVGEILAAIGNMPAQMDAARLRQMQMQQQQQMVQLQNQIATLPTTVQQPGQQVSDLSPGWSLNEDVQPPSNILAPQQAPPTAGDIFGGTANIPGATVPNPAFEQARTKLDVLRGKSPLEDQILKLQLQNLGKQTVAETQAGSREKVAGVKADVTREGIASRERISANQLKSLDENRKAILDLKRETLDFEKSKEKDKLAMFDRHQADMEKLHGAMEDNYQSAIATRAAKATTSNETEIERLKIQWSNQRKGFQQLMTRAVKDKDPDTYKQAATEYNRLAKLSNDNEENPDLHIEEVDVNKEFGWLQKAISIGKSLITSPPTAPVAAGTTPPKKPSGPILPPPSRIPAPGNRPLLKDILSGKTTEGY